MQNRSKLLGWMLCLASLVLLACLGRLDLLIILLPLSAVFTFLTGRLDGWEHNANRTRKDGIT